MCVFALFAFLNHARKLKAQLRDPLLAQALVHGLPRCKHVHSNLANGFSFCAWLRLLRSATPGTVSGRQCILSLRMYCEWHFEVSVTGPDCALHVRVSHKGHPHEQVVEQVRLRHHHWEFFAFSFSRSSNRRTGDLTVMVNGELKWKRSFPFPRFTMLSHAAIGYSVGANVGVAATTSVLEMPPQHTSQNMHQHQLSAQVNALHLFASSLSNGELRRMFELGLDYIGTFGLLSAGSPSLAAKLLLCLSPSLTSHDGNLFLNTCRRKTGSKVDAFGVVARRMPGTHASILWNAHDMLDCIGGILVMFPLFAQLLLQNPHTQDDTINKDLAASILDLMVDLLRGHKGKFNRRLMERYSGLQVVGYALRRINAAYLTIDCVRCVEDLFFALDGTTSLQRDVVRFLFADFHLWSRAEPKVQVAVAKTLQDLSFSSLSASSPAAKKANAKPEKNVGDSFKTRRAEFTSEESTMKMSQSGLRPSDPSTLRVGVPLLVQV